MSQVLKTIDDIQNLISVMGGLPQVDCPVQHSFSDGIYAREITMFAGTCVVGKIHKTNHINIITSGQCTVVTPARSITIDAPYTFESFAGEQKVVYCHTDVTWTTIHKTDSTDLAVIEQECISSDYNSDLVHSLIMKVEDTLCLGQ